MTFWAFHRINFLYCKLLSYSRFEFLFLILTKLPYFLAIIIFETSIAFFVSLLILWLWDYCWAFYFSWILSNTVFQKLSHSLGWITVTTAHLGFFRRFWFYIHCILFIFFQYHFWDTYILKIIFSLFYLNKIIKNWKLQFIIFQA